MKEARGGYVTRERVKWEREDRQHFAARMDAVGKVVDVVGGVEMSILFWAGLTTVSATAALIAGSYETGVGITETATGKSSGISIQKNLMSGTFDPGRPFSTGEWVFTRIGAALGLLGTATGARGATQPVANNFEQILRGSQGERGVGVFHIDPSAVSVKDLETAIAATRDIDFQAGMAGGLTRQTVSNPVRVFANKVASWGRTILSLGESEAAGHLPDVGAGGTPVGVITGLPKKINSSFLGQLKRYQPGFVFEGFSLIDRNTGQALYPSLSLELNPPRVRF